VGSRGRPGVGAGALGRRGTLHGARSRVSATRAPRPRTHFVNEPNADHAFVQLGRLEPTSRRMVGMSLRGRSCVPTFQALCSLIAARTSANVMPIAKRPSSQRSWGTPNWQWATVRVGGPRRRGRLHRVCTVSQTSPDARGAKRPQRLALRISVSERLKRRFARPIGSHPAAVRAVERVATPRAVGGRVTGLAASTSACSRKSGQASPRGRGGRQRRVGYFATPAVPAALHRCRALERDGPRRPQRPRALRPC
jgi:hypothetical protein